MLVLSLSEANKTMKKWSCKQGIFYPVGTKDFKMVFILLIDVVIFHLRLIPISSWVLALIDYFQSFFSRAWINFTNTFMSFVNRFLVKKGTKDRVGALVGVKAPLLLILNLFVGPWPVGSSYSSGILAK